MDRPLDGMHVLLVEDTLVLQTIQRKVLNQLGATIELAGDGANAVDMFKHDIESASVSGEHNVPLPCDFIFMHCQMPEMDGYEATRRIREEESRYGIRTPIIALTAHSMEEDLQKAIHAGMDLHMTKPIERRRIVEAVHGVCKKTIPDVTQQLIYVAMGRMGQSHPSSCYLQLVISFEYLMQLKRSSSTVIEP